jgi:hypothetical protein
MYARENTREQISLIPSIFLRRHFLSCRPIDCREAVQEKVVSLHRILDNMHEVSVIRFVGSASSTPSCCNLNNHFIYVPFFDYVQYIQLHQSFDYIDCSTTSTVCHFYSHHLVR